MTPPSPTILLSSALPSGTPRTVLSPLAIAFIASGAVTALLLFVILGGIYYVYRRNARGRLSSVTDESFESGSAKTDTTGTTTPTSGYPTMKQKKSGLRPLLLPLAQGKQPPRRLILPEVVSRKQLLHSRVSSLPILSYSKPPRFPFGGKSARHSLGGDSSHFRRMVELNYNPSLATASEIQYPSSFSSPEDSEYTRVDEEGFVRLLDDAECGRVTVARDSMELYAGKSFAPSHLESTKVNFGEDEESPDVLSGCTGALRWLAEEIANMSTSSDGARSSWPTRPQRDAMVPDLSDFLQLYKDEIDGSVHIRQSPSPSPVVIVEPEPLPQPMESIYCTSDGQTEPDWSIFYYGREDLSMRADDKDFYDWTALDPEYCAETKALGLKKQTTPETEVWGNPPVIEIPNPIEDKSVTLGSDLVVNAMDAFSPKTNKKKGFIRRRISAKSSSPLKFNKKKLGKRQSKELSTRQPFSNITNTCAGIVTPPTIEFEFKASSPPSPTLLLNGNPFDENEDFMASGGLVEPLNEATPVDPMLLSEKWDIEERRKTMILLVRRKRYPSGGYVKPEGCADNTRKLLRFTVPFDFPFHEFREDTEAYFGGSITFRGKLPVLKTSSARIYAPIFNEFSYNRFLNHNFLRGRRKLKIDAWMQ